MEGALKIIEFEPPATDRVASWEFICLLFYRERETFLGRGWLQLRAQLLLACLWREELRESPAGKEQRGGRGGKWNCSMQDLQDVLNNVQLHDIF